MSIINFSFTGTADRLKIKARVTGNDSRFIGTCECYLAPFPAYLLETIESEQQAFINWLSGNNSDIPSAPPIPVETNIPDLSQSSVPSLAFGQAPIEMQTNNPSFGQCRRLGEQKTRLFKQWMDTPPPSDNPDAPLLPNSASLRGELSGMLTLAEYRNNPNNHSFVIHTDTFDPDLNRRLQKLPFHTWGFMAAYDDAEVAFSTNEYTVSQASSDPPRVFVILGNDVDDNFESHRQAIERELLGFAAPEYWSCNAKNPISSPKSIQHPENNLYETLNQSIKEKRSPAILIFVGHTSSINIQGEASSQIWLNNQISISPATPAFKKILQELTKEGLIFAAFFSCNGLNIAHELMKEAEIPYILVSRDRLPIHIALISITQFLGRATEPGVSINMALHHVRQYLQRHVETIPTKAGCPNASNLLVLFQNPTQPAYILRPLTENPPSPVVQKSWWQKINGTLISWFPNKKLKYLAIGIVGIFLFVVASIVIDYFLYPYPATACDDIRHTNLKPKFVSCGEETLLKYPDLSSDQKNLYEKAKEELKKTSPDYSMVVKNLENLKDNPEISVAYYNAQAKENLKTGIPIKTIAIMLPLSDYIKNEEDDLPKSILTAVAQAQSQWNSDRNIHWNLEVLLVNDFNDPKNFSPVNFIIQQQKILGATSNYNSSLTTAFAPLYKNKLTIISATNTAKNLTNIISNYFRITGSTDVQAENIINFLYKQEEKIGKVAIFSEEGESNESVFANSFKQSIIQAGKSNGRIEILNSDLFKLNENMISNTEANKIKSKGYEAVIINSNSFTNSKLPSKILDLISNISEKSPKCLIIGNEVVADSLLVQSMKDRSIKTDNLLISLPWSETSMSSLPMTNYDGKNFDASKLRDIPIRHRAFLTYDAMYILLDAINKGVNDNKNDSQIKTELPTLIGNMTKEGKKYFGVTGFITINGSDRTEPLYGLVKVKFDSKTKTTKLIKAY